MTLLTDDRALLEAFRRGDPAALRRVYEAYSADVTRYLARGFVSGKEAGMSRHRMSPIDVDAAHQETFIRAFQPTARAAYDGLRPYRPFLLTIAHSAAVDALRAHGKLGAHTVAFEEAPQALEVRTEAPSPEDSALEAEIRRTVRRFLDALSPEAQAFAQCRYIDGLSQEDTAQRLGLSRKEVRTRERHLKAAFARHLEDSGWEEGSSGTLTLWWGALVLAWLGRFP